MGRKRSKKGAGRARSGRGTSPRDGGVAENADNRAAAGPGPQEPARLLLTRLLRDGVIWKVYVSTSPQGESSNVTQLEFEGVGPERKKLRYTRPIEGPLLDALHNGTPVSRAALEEELELAAR